MNIKMNLKMNLKMRYFMGILLLSCFGLLKQTKAQNTPHFTLYHYNSLVTNPATLGRGATPSVLYSYRHQPVIGNEEVSTHILSFAYPVIFDKSNHQLTLGGGVIADNQVNFLKNTQGIFSVNYSLPIAERQTLGLGVQASLGQRRIDIGDQSTDSQFQNGSFDTNLGLNESLDGLNKSYLGLDVGLYWQGVDDMDRQLAFIGLSLFNLNEPDVSFTDNIEVPLSRRFIATAGVRVLQKGNVSMTPNLRWINEGSSDELNIGTWVNYQFVHTNIGLGGWYNTNNSMAVSAELNHKNYLIAMAYNFRTNNELDNIMPDGVFEVTVGLRLNPKRKAQYPPVTQEPVKEKPIEVKEEPVKEEPIEVKEEPVKEEPIEVKEEPIEEKELPLSPEEETILAQTIQFVYNTDKLDAKSEDFLQKVSKILKKRPRMMVELTGHTCNWGDEEKNQSLSESRAKIVADYLLRLGVPAKQIQTKGYGETQPIDNNMTEEGRRNNRRVEFKVLN